MATTPDRSRPVDPGRELWERLRDDDPTAPADIVATYLGAITDWLSKRHPEAGPDDCLSAAGEAIVTLSKNPLTYKPERQSLEVYLRMSARGDLLNLLRTERRHQLRRVDLDAVEHSPRAGKYLQDEDADPALIVERREMLRERAAARLVVPASVMAGLTAAEVQFVELMNVGERKTVVYAQVLGLADRSVEEQRREVKRVKDRLTKRSERARKRHE